MAKHATGLKECVECGSNSVVAYRENDSGDMCLNCIEDSSPDELGRLRLYDERNSIAVAQAKYG